MPFQCSCCEVLRIASTFPPKGMVTIERTDSTSHIRTVWSSEAEARYTLSVDQDISDKPFVWPLRLRMSSPVNGDQILTTLSFAVMDVVVSLEIMSNVTLLTT